MQFKRFVLIILLPGLITILCHAKAFAPDKSKMPSRSGIDLVKPSANDDFGTTAEETSVTINVLLNDTNGDDDNPPIDPSTVDLNTQTQTVDNAFNSVTGSYSVNSIGNVTYFPAMDFNGTASLRYTVNDVEGRRSNEASLRITVSNINDPPVITGQTPNPLTTNEDQSIIVTLNHLTVTDQDNDYPEDFTLSFSPGANYTVSGNTVTPNPEFVGTLSVPVSVNDGSASSNMYDLQIAVSSVNDAPSITGQNPTPLTTSEEQSITIVLGNLSVTDADDVYPTDFTLTVSAGTNYSVSGNTITPVANFEGTLSVPVTVNDGEINSNVFNLEIVVSGINDSPVITGQNPNPLTTGEDQSITVTVSNLLITDPDDSFPSDFTLTVSSGSNYTLSGNTVIPDNDFAGTLSVPVFVNDGEANSNTYDLQIAVSATNDVPAITGQSSLTVDEDNSIRVTLLDLTVIDSDNNYPADFVLTLSPGSNYTLSGTTVVPSTNFSGSLSVPAVVNDGSNDSQPFNLQITVNPVNDSPEISGQANLSTSENQAIEINFTQLTVIDPDNAYPNGFTLSVLPGNNYSVSGSLVTPAQGFNGILSVGIVVNDGDANSNAYDLQITVNAINDPPVITGQQPLSVLEDNSFTIQLSDLSVADPDNTYPTGFSIFVMAGENYSVTGTTVIPAINFVGNLAVGVKVNDGSSDSAPYNLAITVTPVNDAPQITGQQALTTIEDQALALQSSHLIVVDPDNNYPNGFSTLLSAGDNYTVSGINIIPDPDFHGSLTVPVQVNDGVLNSNIFNLSITVTDSNDPPIITGQTPLSTNEDTPVTITLSHLTVLDPDDPYPTGFTLSISSGTNYAVSGNTVTPALDFTGTLNVSLTVNDGVSSSQSFVFQIQVGDTNDPPVITGQLSISTNEEQSFTILLSHLTVTDPDNPYPNGFSLLVSPGEDYSLSASTVTPSLNFAGTLTIPIRVNDGVNNSATFNLKLVVNPINDAPSFDAIPSVTIAENAKPGKINIRNISKGPGEDSQQLTFVISSGNTEIIPHPVVAYNGSSTSAELSYSILPNKSGIVTITVTAIDNGSNSPPNQNSFSSSFQIAVSEINSAPTLDVISNIIVQEDSGVRNITLTGITAGPGENQPLTAEVSVNKPELLESLLVNYVSPLTTGTLQIKPKENAYGSVQITVKVTDNGSSIAPSVNSFSRSFTVSIEPVNDLPVFISIPVTVAAILEPYNYVVEIKDVESENLPITVVEKPAWLTFTVISGKSARLTGTPPAAATGMAQVKIAVKDGSLNVEQQYSIIVNTRPSVSSFGITTDEDVAFTFQSALFTNAYVDVNQHSLKAILITGVPVSGILLLSDQPVDPGDTIPIASLGSLIYKPDLNYDDKDMFQWKASDGYHLSSSQASVDIEMRPVNDAPMITLETDSLQYEVNGEPAILTTLFEIEDPDNDSLTYAQLAFRKQNYYPEYDMLQSENSPGIKSMFDFHTGMLSLTGKASLREYERLIRSVRYNHLNTLDPDLKLKSISIALNDGKVSSETKDRVIALKYTFIDLEIPSGFTPNGDYANDTWVITRPGGIEKLQDAIVRVFNRRGVLVYQSLGFDHPWDGTMQGELVPADTYFFTIDLKLRSKKTYKGIVTILR